MKTTKKTVSYNGVLKARRNTSGMLKTIFLCCKKLLPVDNQNVFSDFKFMKEVMFLPEEKKKGKAEETAEKTGEVVGKGLKKGFGVAKGIGSGLKKGVKGDDKKEEKK